MMHFGEMQMQDITGTMLQHCTQYICSRHQKANKHQ